MVLFWLLTYVGSWFNGLTLVILAYLAAFSLPKVYDMNKAQIDQYIQLACTQIQDVVNKYEKAYPVIKYLWLTFLLSGSRLSSRFQPRRKRVIELLFIIWRSAWRISNNIVLQCITTYFGLCFICSFVSQTPSVLHWILSNSFITFYWIQLYESKWIQLLKKEKL